MDIEEEIAELIAELEKRNEDPKLIRYVKSFDYKYLLKREETKICDVCGKEFKITHLCETEKKLNWTELWKNYSSQSSSNQTYTATKTTVAPSTTISQSPIILTGEEDPTKKNPSYTTSTTQKDESNPAAVVGICCCFLLVIVLLVVFISGF